ncbi:MAG: HAMP domain-containing protein, partial [Novipirellula sp. JB048]
MPLIAASMVAAAVVAFASYRLGDRWSRTSIEARYDSIEAILAGSPFPLTQSIVQSLSRLTDTELIAIAADGRILNASIPISTPAWAPPLAAKPAAAKPAAAKTVADAFAKRTIGEEVYLYKVFSRLGPASGNDGVDRIAVLFRDRERNRDRLRAAAFPLATGISTILLLSSVTFWIANPLINRLSHLQRQVNAIAEGHFDTEIPTAPRDELGLLGASVQRMSDQLSQMWQQLNRKQGEKLLHQLASGLAHQLRNSLTGARMAIELHQRGCPESSAPSLAIAIDQIEQTEDYVRQLMLVAAGKQDEDRPERLLECIERLQISLAPIARHRHVDLQWSLSDDLAEVQLSDGPSYSAAVSNLVLNAIAVGSQVQVRACCER